MERCEIDAELGTPDTKELLASKRRSRTSLTFGPDATPRVVPVGFWWTGEEFRDLHRATTSPKGRRIAGPP